MVRLAEEAVDGSAAGMVERWMSEQQFSLPDILPHPRYSSRGRQNVVTGPEGEAVAVEVAEPSALHGLRDGLDCAVLAVA